MAPSLSKYLTKNNTLICGGLVGACWFLIKSRKFLKKPRIHVDKRKRVEEEVKYQIAEKDTEKIKAHVNLDFLRQLLSLIKIVVPRWNSMEIFYLIFVAASLMARTFCDVLMLHSISGIESSLILLDKKVFTKRIIGFLISLPLFSVTNNLLKFAVGELKIRLRKNLSLHLYNDYLQKFTYYGVTNLDKRISNADQILTADVEKFCDTLADLYCNVSKPLLDIGLFSYQIAQNVGSTTPVTLLIYFLVSGVLLTTLRRPIAQLTVMDQKLEGEFRHINSRLITHSEEIAFYQGNMREKLTIMTSFNNLMRHARRLLRFRVLVGVIDNICAKYLALVIGWYTYSMPFLTGTFGLGSMPIGERARVYYVYGFMIIRLAQSVGRMVLAGGELTRLAGLTLRVTQLQNVLNDMNSGVYQRTVMVQDCALNSNRGKLIFKDNVIKFDQVPVITPNGDVLINELTIDIQSGMNVLVCGPNGAGKSSIFRILGELWPLFGGKLTKPPSGKLFYIPQRPYMVLGSLRDQITYPQSGVQAKRRGYNDEQLEHYLKIVQLEYLLEREGGLDALADWLDVLSGGEKQRIAMARLLYHSPQFAILDECTSAVSIDVENIMYSYCRNAGITLLTVSHRKSLWKHHEYVLYLDGRGSYSFSPIQDDMEQFGS